MHNVKEARIKALLKKTKGENTECLFHHRLATSTKNTRNACHPFSTKDTFDYEYIGVHNGVVQNAHELKRQHEQIGIEYVSLQEPESEKSTWRRWNDSESLIYDLARYFEGDVSTLTAAGAIAFIVVRVDSAGRPRTLFFGTNRGALKMKRTKKNMVISSEGDGEEVPENVLHMYDYDTDTLTTEPMDIPRNYSYSYSPNRSGSSSAHTHTPATSGSTPSASRQTELDSWADDTIRRGYEGRSTNALYNEEEELSAEDRRDMAEALDMLDEEEEQEMLAAEKLDAYFGIKEGEFVVLLGTKRDLKKRFLSNHRNKHHDALVAVRGVMAGAQEEVERLNKLQVTATEAEEVLAYYARVTDYLVLLSEVADELKEEAQRIADSGSKRDSRIMGFCQPESTNLLTKTTNKLTT